MSSGFQILARDYLIVPTVTKDEHDEAVEAKRRPYTQEPIGHYSRKERVEVSE